MDKVHPSIRMFVDEVRKRARNSGSIVFKNKLWMDLNEVDDVSLEMAVRIFEENIEQPFADTIEVLELLSACVLEHLAVLVVPLPPTPAAELAKRYLNELLDLMEQAGLSDTKLLEAVFTTKWWFTTLYLRHKLFTRSSESRRWSLNK